MSSASIDLDLSSIVASVKPYGGQQLVDKVVELVVAEAQQLWANAVSGELLPGMDRQLQDKEYLDAVLNGLNVQRRGTGDATLDVSAAYPEAERIETGTPAFDQKPGFLRSSKVKRLKNGEPYLDIPFKHGAPFKPKAGQKPVRRGYASTLSWSTYRDVADFQVNGGERFFDPSTPVTKPAVGGMTSPYQHKVAKLQDLQKRKRPNERVRYMTFRRVSPNSDPNAWWLPATAPNRVAQAVSGEVNRRAQALVSGYLAGFLQKQHLDFGL